jgi:hypothetical protein
LVLFLGEEDHRNLLRYMLSAVLMLPPNGRLFIAAPAETVALCVYGLLRVLPVSLLADVTFSTYEHSPLLCGARVVGTSWAGRTNLDLPAACYAPPNVGLNVFRDNRSALAHFLPFAEHAVAALAGSDWQQLDQFSATCERLGSSEPLLIDRVYRMGASPRSFDRDDAREALRNPHTARLLIANAEIRPRLLSWLLDDPQFAHDAVPRIAEAGRSDRAVLSALASGVQEEALASVPLGRRERVEHALERVAPGLSPNPDNEVWLRVGEAVADPHSLTWDMFAYFLPRVIRAAGCRVRDAWLSVPSERLTDLLRLDLSDEEKYDASALCLRTQGKGTSAVVQALLPYPTVFWTTLERFLKRPEDVRLAQAMVLGRHGGQLVKDDSRHVLRYPELAAWIACDQRLADCVIGWAVEDRDYAKECLPLVAAVRPGSERLRLADLVVNQAVAAAERQRKDHLQTALELVLPRVAPARTGTVWAELARLLREPNCLALDVWEYMLPHVVSAGSEPNLRNWLAVPTTRLTRLLELKLPSEHKRTACLDVLLRDGALERPAVRHLAREPNLCCDLLAAASGAVGDRGRLVTLFQAVMAEQPPRELFDRLRNTPDLIPEIRERLNTMAVLNRFVNQPVLDTRVLGDVARSLAILQSDPLHAHRFSDSFASVLEAVVGALLDPRATREPQQDLEHVLLFFGRFTPHGPEDLYRNMLDSLMEKPRFWDDPRLPAAFIAIGLGATRSADLQRAVDSALWEDALNLAERVGKVGGLRAFAEIERELPRWPPTTQRLWRLFRRFIGPKSAWDRLREKAHYVLTFLFVIGLLWILKLIGLL